MKHVQESMKTARETFFGAVQALRCLLPCRSTFFVPTGIIQQSGFASSNRREFDNDHFMRLRHSHETLHTQRAMKLRARQDLTTVPAGKVHVLLS